MPCFFARRQGDRVVLEGTDARHLAGALRARPGERISVVERLPGGAGGGPQGSLLVVRLETVGRERVVGVVESETPHRPEPDRRITVAFARLPSSALDLVLSRCTEVGAAGFVVVAAERSVARTGRPERWATVCREAAMLAGRLEVPAVAGPLLFPAAWRAAPEPYLLDRGGDPMREVADGATLFVGPEGGWSEPERALASGRRLSLGPRNLRADTAALVGLALALGLPRPGGQ